MKDSICPLGLWCFAVSALCLVAAPLPAAGADDGVISDSAIQQIRALEQEKAARPASLRKLDSQFVYQLRQSRNQLAAPGLTQLRPQVKFAADGRVLVDIEAEVTSNLLAQITQSGGTIVASYPAFRSLRALVSLDQLETLAGSGDVKFIGRAREARAHAGSFLSEGDATHRAGFARNYFGVTGQGVKIGVLSDSVDYLQYSQLNGELPAVTVLPGQSGSGRGEGTAMLEVIHDLAPGAELFFATGNNGAASFAQNILALRSNGCDIIVDDISYLDESPFQDGIIAQAVSNVINGGAIYFSAAGNDGNVKHNTSGTWEGDFADAGQATPPVNIGGGRVHSFGPVSYDTVPYSGNGYVVLFWSDPLGASANDYDLFVLDSSGSYVVSSSLNVQDGTQDPFEFAYANSGNRIVIVKASGEARFMHLAIPAGTLGINTSGATKGHSTVPGAISVAAVSAQTSYPNPFTGGGVNPVESSTSDGPRRVFFKADGTPITPGNLLSGGGAIRQKPDLAAADVVSTSVPGFQPFVGTSSAAAHAAAIAALVKSCDPSISPGQLKNTLAGTALDIEAPGPDANSGAGLIMADAALQLLPARPVMLGGTSTLLSESCPNAVLDPGEIVTLSFSLTNVGTAATSNLVATLVPSGAVVGAVAPQNYGSLAAHGGTASRAFTFTVAGSCGELSLVTLHLQDGPRDLGDVSFGFRLGTPRFPLNENFEGAPIPGLPAGWSSILFGAGAPWETVSYFSDSNPNSAHASQPGAASDKSLISPSIPILSSSAQLTFRHYMYSYYYAYDGGVLEISTNGGPFTDILAAGGSFATNGYFTTVYTGVSNAIEGRMAWTGYTGGFITTVANLPASAAGQNVRFRWRFSTAYFGGGDGWYVDSISLFDGYGCCGTLSNNLVISISESTNSVVLGSKLTYAIYVQNTGPLPATGVTLTNTLPAGVSFASATLSQGTYTNSGQSVVCNLGSLPGGSIAVVLITGIPFTPGTITNRVTVGRAEPDATLTDNSATAVATVILPSLSINNVSIFEGNSGTTNAVFTVTLSPPSEIMVSVEYATSGQSATAGDDFVTTAGTLKFSPGQTTNTISVPIIGDIANEPDEWFTVDLSNPNGAEIASSQGIGTILNDDPLPRLSISDASVVEGDFGSTNAVFTVSLAGASGQTVSVYYYTSDVSASAADDYVGTSGYLNFNPGETTKTVIVAVNGDLVVESNETFNVVLSSPYGAKLARSTAVGTILNDDGLPGNLYSFAWSPIASPQSNGLPIPVIVSALDYFNHPATNFHGPAALEARRVTGTRTGSLFGNIDYQYLLSSGYTYGYSFVPNVNLTVTHVRHYSGNKVSLWTDDGVLLASTNVVSVAGTWVETPLTSPVQLLAGHTYRIGIFTSGDYGYARYDQGPVFPDATIQKSFYAYGNTFPNTVDSTRYPLVDLKYSTPTYAPVLVTPTNLDSFSNGNWSGNITVPLPATNVSLRVSDAIGRFGDSLSFDVAPAPGQITHFAWSPVSPPVSNGAPFAVNLSARDFFGNLASNYSGTASLTASGTPTGIPGTLLDSPAHSSSVFTIANTYGYTFTPGTDILVTHFRHYFGIRVSLWTYDGVLIAGKNVTSVPGTWVQTPLDEPVQLYAGSQYRLGVVVGGNLHYWRNDMPGTFPFGTIDQGYTGQGNTIPTIEDSTRWHLVDIAYVANGFPGSLFMTPTNADNFVNGVWNHNVTIFEQADGVRLMADDGLGRTGQSSAFNVGPAKGQATHFVWNPIPSPQLIGEPFPITISALDYLDGPASNFTGQVALSGTQTGLATNNMLGNAVASDSNNSGILTLGNSFTPTTNLTVTHVRHYFGTKVSIWTDAGALLAVRTVTSVPGTWVETPLTTPLQLVAGQTYRVAVFTGGNTYYGRFDQSSDFPNGTINQTYNSSGDRFPEFFDSWRWFFVDLKYTVVTNGPIAIDPLLSGNFAGGVWTGGVAVLQSANSVKLTAMDALGHSAVSSTFAVAPTPKIAMKSYGNVYEVSWPAGAAGFVLEETHSLTPPVVWTPAPEFPFLANGRLCVTNTLPSGKVFYRLRKP